MIPHNLRWSICASLFSAALLVRPASAQGMMLELGSLGGSSATANDVSADGSVIVGLAFSPSGFRRAFRWDGSSGMQDLGTLGGGSAEARAVSADGSTIVGLAYTAAGELRAFRWHSSSGMQDLGTLPGAADSTANDVNADGSVIVGFSGSQAFRWTAATGMVDFLGASASTTSAQAVSADGTVIVGKSGNLAYRWTAATGLVALPPQGSAAGTFAADVSADGSTVVGFSYPAPFGNPPGFDIALSWPGGGAGPVVLGFTADASGISADGAVVVGSAGSFGGFPAIHAVMWTPAGMQSLNSSGFAYSANSDGAVIVGQTGNRAVRWLLAEVGARYCTPGASNSTGSGGRLHVLGSDDVARNDVELAAESLPQGAFGFFLASRHQGSPLAISGSQGLLCLGGFIGRFVAPGQIVRAGSMGTFSLRIDLNAVPTPFGPVAVQPGETWNFQAWHRDANPTLTSNFTDAVSVTFH